MRHLPLLFLVACFGGSNDDDIRIVRDTSEDPTFQGVVSVSPERLDILATPGGDFAVGTVSITNVGEYPLDIREVAFEGGNTDVLQTDEETNGGRTLGPDRTYEALIRCELPPRDTDPIGDTDAGPDGGTLIVRTNDADRPRVQVPVTCTPDA